MTRLNRRDIKHLREEFFAMRSDEACDGEEGGPEVVMTSIGYVDLWSDGEVSSDGETLGTFDDDGDWSGESDPADADGEE